MCGIRHHSKGESLRSMSARSVGKYIRENDELIFKSTAVVDVEDISSIRKPPIKKIGLESDDSDLISGYTVLK